MKNIAVVYWSGTGNTETMANSIAEGINTNGGKCTVFTASEFSAGLVGDFDTIVFGCPAMGAEMLEDGEFEPMFDSCKTELKDKSVALFGSYDWGGGEWMTEWESECKVAGAELVCESMIVNNSPSDEDKINCNSFGKALVDTL